MVVHYTKSYCYAQWITIFNKVTSVVVTGLFVSSHCFVSMRDNLADVKIYRKIDDKR
jgi:hypothetical protein